MTIRELRNRIETAEATIRPANSLAARLKKLSPEQRATYDQWQIVRAKWASQFCEPDGMFRAILDGNEGPQLPLHIRNVLFDKPPKILATDDEATINEKWQKFLRQ